MDSYKVVHQDLVKLKIRNYKYYYIKGASYYQYYLMNRWDKNGLNSHIHNTEKNAQAMTCENGKGGGNALHEDLKDNSFPGESNCFLRRIWKGQ